jgi:hypothetical protein
LAKTTLTDPISQHLPSHMFPSQSLSTLKM